jgi:iron complex transport system permease protein
VTALIGAPLLLWLLPRLRSISAPVMDGGDKVQLNASVLWFAWRAWRCCCWRFAWRWPLGAMPRLALGHGRFAGSTDAVALAAGASALFAGVMLAVAGCIIQRLTGNPMASPEVLGISSGAVGVVLMLFVPAMPLAGCCLPAVSVRRPRC